jgi:hypothetical protein
VGEADGGCHFIAWKLYHLAWTVRFEEAFEAELLSLHPEVRNPLLAVARMLETYGPRLGRPHVDTLKGSRFSNMKEMRFDAEDGVWRVAFAFDPMRQAVLLVAGDKSGTNERRFYRRLIDRADTRYAAHLRRPRR